MTRTHEIKLDGYGAHTTLADDRPVMLLGTAESYGIEMLHIAPGKDWEGLTITATFNAADGSSTDVLMGTDGNIAVPAEATAKSGSGRIVFTGVSNGIQRISCDLDYFVVAHSDTNGTQSGGTAPSWFEQAVTRFMPTGGTAGQVLTKLSDADFKAKWQDSKGGGTTDHSQLINRDIADQHPISAITGLEEALTPLTGTTETLTPTQVYDAIKSGKSVALQQTNSQFGLFTFASFNIFEGGKAVVSTSIAKSGDEYLVGSLAGFARSNDWVFNVTKMAEADDIPVAVNAALAQAKESGEFDGADGITPTIGDNGNWYLGSTDTGKPSRGKDGKSAYSYAQDGGYTGTEAEFAAKLAAEGLDKALFVVNITTTDGVTYSADKTFDEIVQAYNEGKYNIVANFDGVYILPLLVIISHYTAMFSIELNQDGHDVVSVTIAIAYDNSVQTIQTPLATTNSKLPNPYPLTFTGAVNETYDGSSAKTITIPSGGGGATIIAEETVLASGTIAAGEAANQYIDTGVTVGNLRQWEYFGFHIINVSSGAHCSFTFGATPSQRIAWSNSSSIALFKWVTSDKTVLQNTGYVSTNNGETKAMKNMIANFGTAGISDRNSSVFYYLASIAGIADDTKVCITTNNSPTVDITWEIRGLIK